MVTRSTRWLAACAGAVAVACGGQEKVPAVVPPPPTEAAPPWAILAVDPAIADVAMGGTLRFGALLGASPALDASWAVLEGAAGGLVDASGTYTAPARTGTFHVQATSGRQTATTTVTVKQGGAIAIVPNPAKALPYATTSFAAVVTGIADQRVTWSIVEGAAGGVVSSGGEYVAGGHGVYHVVATSASDPSARAVAEVQVTADLEDLGGPIIPNPTAHALWWGTPQDFGDAVDVVGGFLAGVDGSPWLAILDPYLRGAKARVTFGGSVFLAGAAPAGEPPPDEVVAAVCAGLDAHGLAPDGKSIYLLFTPAPQGSGGWWGTHWYGLCHGVPISANWISRRAYAAGCGAASPEAQAAVATVSHELAESMTDPDYFRAWVSWDAEEIADRCAISCVELGGAVYAVEALWSNAVHGCVVR